MARTRRTKPELTESWDAMDDDYEDTVHIYDDDEERDELGDEYRPRLNGSKARSEEVRESSRRRSSRLSAEPELIMPLSPDGAAAARITANRRDGTPRFRMNDRSLTSDAGQIRKTQRAATPRMRMTDRSMTSDAGRFRAAEMRNAQDPDYDSDDEGAGSTAKDAAARVWQGVLQPILGYAIEVAGLALRNLKPLLGWVLFLYLLGAALVFGMNFLTNSMTNALSPVCRLPFTSHLSFCPSSNTPELKGTAEFDKLAHAQDAFQDILSSTSTGATLPMDMKRSESSIRDLKHVVQYSSLPSKNELVFEFQGFIDTARQASQDLSRFNSRIGRAVDHILSTNRWTLSVIDGVSADEASKGAISKWVGKNLNIFAPFQPVSLSRDILLDQYLRHTGAVEEQIQTLISEASALLDILDNLDGRLDVISGIVTRDGIKVEMTKDELFAFLWTKLGGNRSSVAKLNQQLELLQNVGTYRRVAWGHVTTTLVKLQEIQHSLEDLRERVALPETIGTDIVPLEVHIESINLGIERLENQRDASRRVEAENYARIVSKAEGNEKRMIGSEKEL